MNDQTFSKNILGSLKTAIKFHGVINKDNYSTAARMIEGSIKGCLIEFRKPEYLKNLDLEIEKIRFQEIQDLKNTIVKLAQQRNDLLEKLEIKSK